MVFLPTAEDSKTPDFWFCS